MRRIIITCVAAVLLSTTAYAERKAACEPIAVDATPQSVLELLASGRVEPVTGATTRHEVMAGKNTKISSQPFIVFNTEGQAIGGGTTTCTATCSGSWCSPSGCTAYAAGCTACSCDGNCYTTCTCKKTTTAETAPAPTTPRDTPRNRLGSD